MAEKGCWPDWDMAFGRDFCLRRYPQSPTPYRFVNSGVWMGYADAAYALLTELQAPPPDGQRTVHSAQRTVHSAQRTAHSAQCTVYSVQRQCTVHRAQCIVHSVPSAPRVDGGRGRRTATTSLHVQRMHCTW